jgi:hypothetical protein
LCLVTAAEKEIITEVCLIELLGTFKLSFLGTTNKMTAVFISLLYEILRRVDEVTGGRRKLRNEELNDL